MQWGYPSSWLNMNWCKFYNPGWVHCSPEIRCYCLTPEPTICFSLRCNATLWQSMCGDPMAVLHGCMLSRPSLGVCTVASLGAQHNDETGERRVNAKVAIYFLKLCTRLLNYDLQIWGFLKPVVSVSMWCSLYMYDVTGSHREKNSSSWICFLNFQPGVYF